MIKRERYRVLDDRMLHVCMEDNLIVEIEALVACMIWRCCLVGGWMLEAMFWAGIKKNGRCKNHIFDTLMR